MNNIIKVGETINAREYMTSMEVAEITGRSINMLCVILEFY